MKLPWLGRFAVFGLLLLVPLVLFALNVVFYGGQACATIILLGWIGVGVFVVEDLMHRREW